MTALQPAIQSRILALREQRVMLDADLAQLYSVETRVLVQAVKRNLARFPEDFMFQLSAEEFANLRSQSVISSAGHGGRRTAPYAFTEQGVAMLSSVLRSERAVLVNIEIMRAFVRLRQILAVNADLARRLDELERHVGEHDEQFVHVIRAIRQLMARTSHYCGLRKGSEASKTVNLRGRRFGEHVRAGAQREPAPARASANDAANRKPGLPLAGLDSVLHRAAEADRGLRRIGIDAADLDLFRAAVVQRQVVILAVVDGDAGRQDEVARPTFAAVALDLDLEVAPQSVGHDQTILQELAGKRLHVEISLGLAMRAGKERRVLLNCRSRSPRTILHPYYLVDGQSTSFQLGMWPGTKKRGQANVARPRRWLPQGQTGLTGSG